MNSALDVEVETVEVTAGGGHQRQDERPACTTLMMGHALRSVKEAVSITDVQARILFVNWSFIQMYGFREEELLGNPITMVQSAKNSEESVSDILPATLRGGWEGEIWNRRRDGTDIQVFLRTAPVRDEAGEIVALIGMATDTTDKKRIQDLLLRSEEMFSNPHFSRGLI